MPLENHLMHLQKGFFFPRKTSTYMVRCDAERKSNRASLLCRMGESKGEFPRADSPQFLVKRPSGNSALPLALTGIGCTFLWSKRGWRGWNRSSTTICHHSWREVVTEIKKIKFNSSTEGLFPRKLDESRVVD